MKTRILTAIRRRGAVSAVSVSAALCLSAAVHANNLTWDKTSGDWDFSSANWTGDASVFANGDDVTFDNTAGGTVTIDGGGVMPGSTTVSADSGDYVFKGGPLGGNGTLTKSGVGTLRLSGANTYTGKTTVSRGTLHIDSIGDVGAASSALGAPTTVADGTIDVGADGEAILNYLGPATTSDRVINAMSGAGYVRIQNFGTGTLTLAGGITGADRSLLFRGNVQDIIVTGVIANGTVTRLDDGTLTLSNTNTFSGDLSVWNGTVSVNSVSDGGVPSALGQGNSIYLGHTAIGTLQFTGANGGACNRALNVGDLSSGVHGGIIENTVAGQTLVMSGPVSGTGTAPLLELAGAGDGELSGNIYGTGLTITMSGSGTWTLSDQSSTWDSTVVESGRLILSGANYGAGPTVVNGGVLQLANTYALNSVATATVNGGQMDLNAINLTLAGLTGHGGVITNSAATPVTLMLADYYSYPPVTHTYTGGIQDGGAANAISIDNQYGIQQLTGTNNYSGTTTVSYGTLVLGTAGAASNSPVTVSDGATLGVAVTAVGSTFNPVSLTVGSGGGATISCRLGNLGEPTAPVIAPGSLTVNGTLTFEVSAERGSLTHGDIIPLLKHASVSGLATALGAVPSGTLAHLVTNAANDSIDLVIDSVDPTPTKWVGINGSSWDINATVNWTNGIAGLTTYTEPDEVLFDDTAVSSEVTVMQTVSPTKVTVDNSVLNYTFDGYSDIGGSGSLVKDGSATLTVNNDNTYVGGTLINSGTVSMGNGGSTGTLGTGAITNNGTLNINRSDSVTISQVISGTGSVGLLGTGTNTLSGANTYSGGTFIGGETTFNIGIGSVNTGGAVVSGATGTGDVTVGDGATFLDTLEQWAVPKVTFQGDAYFSCVRHYRQRVVIGTLDLDGGTRTLHLDDATYPLALPIPTPLGGGAQEGTGRDRWETFNLDGPMVVTNGNLILDSNLTGNQYAGFMFLDASAFANNAGLTVGTNVCLQTLNSGALGSTTNDVARLTVYGVWTMVGSEGQTQREDKTIYSLAGNGRVFASIEPGAANPRHLWIIGDAGTTEFSGVLGDGTDSGKLALLKTGGSTQILSGEISYTGDTTVSNGTLALSGSGSIAGDSSVEVDDGAMLDLSGNSTSTTLTLTNGSLTGGGTVKGALMAQAGSTVSPGSPVGTLHVANNATINGTLQLELNRTNTPSFDRVVSDSGTVTYGGDLVVKNVGPTLQVGDKFQLFPSAVTTFSSIELATNDAAGGSYTWTNKVAIDGSIEVLTAPPPPSVAITATLGPGNTVIIDWPTDHAGWLLEMQTNAPGVGIGTNWMTVPDSELGHSFTNGIDPAQGSVFYRLVSP